MTKSKDRLADKPRRENAALDGSAGNGDGPSAWSGTVRETIESVVIAFVLAFLFRTFQAEAFVIPTGSMAPTLMGRHMDLKCPKCGFPYQVGAHGDGDEAPGFPAQDIQSSVCPNCRYRIDFGAMLSEDRSQYAYYNGDRILVSKFAFDFTEPQRWNVIVFKYPEDAKTNYIKRLIGLSGEIIRIRDGEIAVSRDGGKTFEMARKDPAKIRATLQTVYDNDYILEPFLAKGWPPRWQSRDNTWNPETRDGTRPDPKAFATNGKASDANSPSEAWLRYYHFVPTREDWAAFLRGEPLTPPAAVQPIHDFIAYDTSSDEMQVDRHPVVTDLAVECQAEVQGTAGKIVLELVKNQRKFRCQLDLSNGTVELSIPGKNPQEQPRAKEGGISRAGSHTILFTNIGHQLTLLVNNKPVQFDRPTAFDPVSDAGDGDRPVGAEGPDFSPVGIGSIGAALRVSHLGVFRDVYYTYIERSNSPQPRPNYALLGERPPLEWPQSDQWFCFPPNAITRLRDAGTEVRRHDQYFCVGDNQFFALGDNSPLSQDGRLWTNEHFIDRRLLVGKALFVYWPHSFDKIRISDEHSIPFPFFPNFGRMGFVR